MLLRRFVYMFLWALVFWRPAKPPCWRWYPARMGSYPWGHSMYCKSNCWVRNSQEYTVQGLRGKSRRGAVSLPITTLLLGRILTFDPLNFRLCQPTSPGSQRGNGFRGDTESQWALIFSEWLVSLGSSGQQSSCHGKISDSHYQEKLGQGKLCWTPRWPTGTSLCTLLPSFFS